MTQTRMIMALAKVMVAAAWMDGAVTNEEINSLKDLLFQMKGLTEREWAELEIYIETPVDPGERARLVSELQDAIASRQDRTLAISALEDLIQADGAISDEERKVFGEVRAALDEMNVNVVSKFGRLIKAPVQRRSKAAASAENRELQLDDFIRNKIYYRLSHRLKQDHLDIDLPDATLRKLSLAGGLMARVAGVDQGVIEDEFEKMSLALQDHFGLSQEAAGFVTEVAISVEGKNLDDYRLMREFFDATNEEERVSFLETLFAVAAADGIVSHEEMEAIRTIATVLKMSHSQFIAAKLSVPREQRAY